MKKLIEDLKHLHNELFNSNNPAAKYIGDIILKLSSHNSSNKEITETIRIIKTGSKIVDYANFTSKQEAIWNEIWKDADELLKKKN